MSGIIPAPGLVDDYTIFKSKDKSVEGSGGVKRKWIIYRIKAVEEDGKKVEYIVKDAEAKKGQPQEEAWDNFCDAFLSKPKDGGYGVFQLEYETKDGRPADGILFVKFIQETGSDKSKVAPIKVKMLYGSTAESFKEQLGLGFVDNIQASGAEDLDLDKILKNLKKKK